MPDPFELLGLPRRPWLDDEEIRRAFQGRARRCHPDAGAGDRDEFSALNAAQAIVASPAGRLRELVGETAIPAMPADLQLGFRTGEAIRKVDTLLEKVGASTNVLARALLADETVQVRRGLAEVVTALSGCRIALEDRLRALDLEWPAVESAALASLVADFTFLARWQGQVRERSLQMEIAFGKA